MENGKMSARFGGISDKMDKILLNQKRCRLKTLRGQNDVEDACERDYAAKMPHNPKLGRLTFYPSFGKGTNYCSK